MPDKINRADHIRLTHMLAAAEQAREFADGKSRQDLETDAMFCRAVLHCIQEIGKLRHAFLRQRENGYQASRGHRLSVCGIVWFMPIFKLTLTWCGR